MARWRAEAIARLPQLREAIASADNVMALWIELSSAFEKAYRRDPPDEALIAGVYAFADWCMDAPRGADAGRDPTTAVVVAFFEDLPTCQAARDDMPRWFRFEEVANNHEVFAYHIGADQYDALLKHMSANRHRYSPR